MTAPQIVTVAAIAVMGLSVASCSGSKETLNCPELEPVTVYVPVPIADSTATMLKEFIDEQTPPTTLNALGDSTSTETIAKEALLEVAYWRRLWTDLNNLLGRISND